ncbi:MAG: hypothetical protein ACR2OU_04495, partial [Thermomicrobiales bacterium]
MAITYEAATTEEVAIVTEAARSGKPIPSGFAINWQWKPPVMRVVGSGAPPPDWSGPETTLLDSRIDAVEATGWVTRPRLAPDVAAVVASVPRDDRNRLTALRPFWTGLAKRATAPVDMLHFGTSITEGAYASTFAQRWVERLRDILRGRFPVASVVGGVGYIPAEYKVNQIVGTPWTYTGGTSGTFGSGLYGLGRRYRVMSALGNKLAISATCSSFDVIYARSTPNGTLGITVDGVEIVTLATAGSPTGGLKLSSGPLTPGTHAIQLTWNAGGPVWVEGIMVYNGDETKG